MGVGTSIGPYPPSAANEFAMNKNVPVGMIGFFVGVLAVFFLISVATAGFKFGKHLAQSHKHPSQASTSASG